MGKCGLTRSISVGIPCRLPALLGLSPLPLQLSYTDVLPAPSRCRLKVCGACNNSSALPLFSGLPGPLNVWNPGRLSDWPHHTSAHPRPLHSAAGNHRAAQGAHTVRHRRDVLAHRLAGAA